MVTKDVLIQYMDLRKEIVEVQERIAKTQKQIDKIEEEGAVVDKVLGGEGGIQSFRIEGFPYPEYKRKKASLYRRKAQLADLELEILDSLADIEEFLNTLDDSYMRRIISLRFVERLSWRQVARRVGGNTEDSVRKAFERFMKEN